MRKFISSQAAETEDSQTQGYGGTAIAVWFTIITVTLALLLDYFLWRALGLDPIIAWLAVINLMALLTYFIDDQYRKAGYPLLPISVFVVQAIIGGAIGAWLGTAIFHHAASQKMLRRYLVWIILAQIGLIVFDLIVF